MRRLRLMLLCLAGFLAAVAGINWVVNPYGAWRPTVIDPAYRVSGSAQNEAGERVTTAYRIRAERPSTLLVGSSRIVWGMYVEHGAQDGVFNASMSGASLAEIAAILRLATANPRLERVLWGLDFYAFDGRFSGFRHAETRMRLEGDERHMLALRTKETLFSLQALDDSRRVILRAVRGRGKERVTVPVPWPEEVIRARLENPWGPLPGLTRADDALVKAQLAPWVDNYSAYQLSEALSSLVQGAAADVRAAGIELVLFVPPLSRCELEAVEQTGAWGAFQAWRRQLVEAGPYWDFAGYGGLERMDSLFFDVAHFWPAVGHVMLRGFLGRGCEQCGDEAAIVRAAGVLVDGATVDAHLARQEARRSAARSEDHRCTRLVDEMLREGRGVAATGGRNRGPDPVTGSR